jgi:hypothetical protein
MRNTASQSEANVYHSKEVCIENDSSRNVSPEMNEVLSADDSSWLVVVEHLHELGESFLGGLFSDSHIWVLVNSEVSSDVVDSHSFVSINI